MKRPRHSVIVLLAIIALVAAACGSNSKSSSGSTPTTTANAAGSVGSTGSSTGSTGSAAQSAATYAQAAQTRVAPLEQAQTSIPLTTPLTQKPPTGKTVYFLEGSSFHEDVTYSPPAMAAARALGWNLKIVSYDSTDPQAVNAAMEQAVSAHADYMIVGAQSVAAAGQGLAAAKAAKVPVVIINGSDEPTGASGNWVFADVNGGQFLEKAAGDLLDWAIADSGANAHILWLSFSDAPIIKAEAPKAQSYIASHCPPPYCSMSIQDVSSSQLTGGQIPSLVVARLQTDPKINYILTPYSEELDGVSQALHTAGMTKVKLGAVSPNQSVLAGLATGQTAAGILYPVGETAYAAFDVFARLSLNMTFDPTVYDVLEPFPIVTSAHLPSQEVLKTGFYQGPSGFQQQFATLWHLG